MGQPELAVLGRVETELEVHELVRSADVELEVLEDGPDAVSLEGERALHAQRVDRARSHPFFDREADVGVASEALRDQRQPDAVLQVTAEQVLAPEVGQHLSREVGQADAGIEGARVVGAQRQGSLRDQPANRASQPVPARIPSSASRSPGTSAACGSRSQTRHFPW